MNQLSEVLAARQGKKLVFTNGVFDILHSGHVRYLAEARALGDLLVVGLNSDASVKMLEKGPERPINPLEDRATVLKALESVDFVIAFDEKTPNDLITLLKPDIHVKGGDYRVEDLPEAEIVRGYGGDVRVLSLVPGRSTTSILKRATLSNREAEPVDLEKLLQESGAILEGHFILTSGRHSSIYFEKFRALERPDVLSALCQEIARKFSGFGIDVVAGPTTGGIIIAFEVARLMGLPALYVESEQGVKTLRRGAQVAPGSRILVVDDVLTTGLSVRETMDCLTERGGEVVAVGVLIDRSGGTVDFGVPLSSSYQVAAESFSPEEVPEWLEKIPIRKPGTRA
ncbi:MAG: D-glycero-beta-D-manno-heptose 1-phosphate adenylyltransferase [Fimbriimonadaceae bacterium]|jgi:orotate phosphoribosyltransferase|nr:D-glycero-beta-D-manno-heptose 1-phosphate adenylyltransferase [Fimbriimonadaceae bacterium]